MATTRFPAANAAGLLVLAALVLFLAETAAAAADADFYDVLELPQREDATERDIKSEWRRLSKLYHPDLKGEATREKYQEIQRAYEVLSDRKKRKVYDMRGEEGLKQLETSAQQGNQPVDPFMRMFGMGGGGDAHKGANLRMVLLVSLEDMYNGAAHNVRFSKQRLCKACRGSGAASKADVVPCKHCGGRGAVVQRVQLMPGFVQEVQQQCGHCGGLGKTIRRKCPVCGGSKVKRGDAVLAIDVERGTPENHELTYELEADQSPDVLPGDVIFTVQSAPHATFHRNGNDLELTQKISLREALLGFERTLKHLDGHEVEIDVPGVIGYGQQRRLKGEGMPIFNIPSEHGDLVVTFEVELPTTLTAAQQDAIRTVFPR